LSLSKVTIKKKIQTFFFPGLQWILKNHDRKLKAIIYFADDDNTYDLRLFDEIRKTKNLSVFPVGFVGSSGSPGITSPIVKNGKVIGILSSHTKKGAKIQISLLNTNPNLINSDTKAITV
jgi:hypothetical protein